MDIAKKHHIILCDDVRHETGNKLSLMGIYGRELVVSAIPAMMPHLCLVVMLEDIVRPFKEIKAKVMLPGSDPLGITIPGPARLLEGGNHTVIVALAPAKIHKPGTGVLELYFFDEETPQIVYSFSIRERNPRVMH